MANSRRGDRPTKAEVDRLVQALGRYIGSGRASPGVKVQQHLYDIYVRTLDRLEKKYPNVSFRGDTAGQQLNERAEAWWDSRVFRGPGVDW